MQKNTGNKQQELQVPQVTALPNSESMFDTSSDSLIGSQSEINETEERTVTETPKKSRRWVDAELLIPPNIIYRKLCNGRYANRVSKEAAVIMSAAIEYLLSEILDMAVDCAFSNQKRRITPRHLMMVIRSDEEFSELLKNVSLPDSGVVPHINESLLIAPRRANRKRPHEDPGTSGGTSGVASKKKKNLQPIVDSDDSD